MNWLDIFGPITHHKDRRSPMYLRLSQCVRDSVENGSLNAGDRLPPDRELAKMLHVDRGTVARAYDELEAQGLVYSHVGRGTFISSRNETVQSPPVSNVSQFPGQVLWTDKFSRSSQNVASIVRRQVTLDPQGDCISFAAGAPTDEFFPHEDFHQIVSELQSSAKAADLFGYSQPEGHPALRQQVLNYLKQQGIDAKDSELLILSGSQQGIDLVARTLVDPDDVVLMEDPTYFWAICTFASHGARLLSVNTGESGIKLDVLENVASRVSAKLLYTMPSFQNPTGATLSKERRLKLLEIARRHQLPILEDNFVGDLCYTGAPMPSLRSLDGDNGTVIYQGTFSKALCPGLRLGWLVAPEAAMSRLRMAKRTCDLSTNSLAQIILSEYLKRGLYQEHLALVQDEYKRRLDAMCAALDKHVSQYLTWTRPDGGMFIWAKLPPGYSSRQLLAFAEREGVIFSPGDVFYLSGGNSEYMRLTFVQQPPDKIQEGIARLAKALSAYGNNRKQLLRTPESSLAAESTFI